MVTSQPSRLSMRGGRVVTNARRDAVDADGVARRAALYSLTAKPCGPGAPMQVPSFSILSRGDGDNKAWSPRGEHGISCKPSRRECPGAKTSTKSMARAACVRRCVAIRGSHDFSTTCHQTVTWRPLMRSSRVMPWSANTGFVENCRSRMTDFPSASKINWPPIRLVATRTSWDRASRLAMPKYDPGPCRLGCNDALPEADPAHFWWSVQISSCTHRAEVLSGLFGDRNLAPAIGIQFEPPSHSGPEASEFR
jgi:hypothetical protein